MSIGYNIPMRIEKYFKEFASNMKAERARKGLTHVQLSLKTGLSTDTLSRIKRGIANPTLDTIINIALALDVDLNTLLPLKK